MTTPTQTATRHPNHLVIGYGRTVVHAASDTARQHTLACNGRTIGGFAWSGTDSEITCNACVRAIASGRAEWAGQTRFNGVGAFFDHVEAVTGWTVK